MSKRTRATELAVHSSENDNKNTGRSGIQEEDDLSDNDRVFFNGYGRKKPHVKAISSDEEKENRPVKKSHASHKDSNSDDTSDGDNDTETAVSSPTPARCTLARKKRIVWEEPSSDVEIPMKKAKLAPRPVSPEYGLPLKKSCDNGKTESVVDTNESAQDILKAGSSKAQSRESDHSMQLKDSTEKNKLLDETKKSEEMDDSSDMSFSGPRKRSVWPDSDLPPSGDSIANSSNPNKKNDSLDDESNYPGYRMLKSSSPNEKGDSSDDETNSSDRYMLSPDLRYHRFSSDEDNGWSDDETTSDDEAVEKPLPADWRTKRAVLCDERYRITKRLQSNEALVAEANNGSAVENAELLLVDIKLDQDRLLQISEEVKKLDAQSVNEASTKKNGLFKENSFEMDPAYLTPKFGHKIKNLGKKAQATLNREQSLTVERLQDLHKSLVARPVDNQKAEDPEGLLVSLMPHQQHALAWLEWREQQKPRGGVLADEMGLGKTLTMVALVMASVAKKDIDGEGDKKEERIASIRNNRCLGGTLVVVPASLLAQWAAEVKTRCKPGTLKVEVYHGPKRETVAQRLAKNDIVITTYNIVCREKPFGLVFKIYWRRVILDEAHVIRNHKSQPCQAVCELFTYKRWAVTGTPLHNKEMDIYSILKFLQCSPFDDVRVWKRWVDNRNDAGHERLSTVMKTVMLRRTKEELAAKGELPPLPSKSVQVIEVKLDPEERLVYDKVMLFSRTLFSQFLSQRAEKHARNNFIADGGFYDRNSCLNRRGREFTKAQQKLLSLHADVQAHEILVLLIRLRQVCCHPSLIKAMLDRDDIELQAGAEIDDYEKVKPMKTMKKIKKMTIESDDEEEDTNDFGIDERVAEHLLTSKNPVFDPNRRSSKMRAVISKIEEVLKKGDKAIIVSQWVGVLDIVADELKQINAEYRMFTGQVAVKDRQGILDDFNAARSEVKVLLISLTAGGVGLNVVGANHMFLIDIHWNPQLEAQAQDRIHRFGQTKDVHIYKYICTDTIEQRIQALQNKKLELARQVLSGTAKVIGSKLTLDDIKSLFGLGPQPTPNI